MRTPLFLLVSTLGGLLAACMAPDSSTTNGRLFSGARGDGDATGTDPSSKDSNELASKTRSGSTSTAPVVTSCKDGARAKKPGGLLGRQNIDVHGNSRVYDLEVPSNYDPTRAYPLVFVFHGTGGSGPQVRGNFGFSNVAGDKAFFVYPTGRNLEWDLDSPSDENEDVALFDKVIDQLSSAYCVDTSRVFSTGFSNGSFFSSQLGCRRGDKLRAIASHGGGGPYGPNEDYDTEGHMKCVGPSPAALVTHGTLDPIVPPGSAPESLKHWTWANGCQQSTKASSPSPCVKYDGCETPVEACIIGGLGHMLWWEGPKKTWDFFAQF